MKKTKRPFAFGLRTTYDLLSWVTSIHFFRYLLMAGGIYAAMLSLELTMLGVSGNPVMNLLPGSEARNENKFREKRFVPKGVDDGAKPRRINPFPVAAQVLAKRSDAVFIYGITGLFGDATEEAAIKHMEERSAEMNYEWEPGEEKTAYQDLIKNPVSKFLRGFEVPEDSLFREEEMANTIFLICIWLGFGGIQSMVWRTVSRAWFEAMFNKANAVKRKKASKDSITTAKIYQVGFNVVDSLIFCAFLALFVGTYMMEFSINGRGLSPAVDAKLLFKLAAVFGFEGSVLLVTGIGDDIGTRPDSPKPQPAKDTTPKPKPQTQPQKGGK